MANEQMERCSVAVIIGEVQIEDSVQCVASHLSHEYYKKIKQKARCGGALLQLQFLRS
jgi:hypothetical protein